MKSALKKLVLAVVAVAILVLGYLSHHLYKLATVGTAIQARRLCSCLFIAGRDVDSIVKQELAPHAHHPMQFRIDYQNKKVTSTVSGFAKRTAIYREGLGSTLVVGAKEEEIRSQPFKYTDPRPKNPEVVFWPTGDYDAVESNPPGINLGKLNMVVDEEFTEPDPERPRLTRAIIVVHNDRIIAEKYAPGITATTPLIGWSMTKGIANALVGILVGQGKLSLHEKAPVDEWHGEDDPRNAITLDHLLHMSSGLDFNNNISRLRVNDLTQMLYRARGTGEYALSKPLRAEPGTEFSYCNGTTNILSTIIRRMMGQEEYFSFPRSALFNRIGMRSAVICPDPSGTFVLSSYSYACARDWARFGLLYLHDGIWEGERILPEGWVEYTRTPAPTKWKRGGYGAHFYLNSGNVPGKDGLAWPGVPQDAIYCGGYEDQYVVVIPSRNLVVVRLGMTHYPLGASWSIGRFLTKLMKHIPD